MAKIFYGEEQIAHLDKEGMKATLNCLNKQMVNNVVIEEELSPLPKEIKTAEEMETFLASAQEGAVIKYVGATDTTYQKGALYKVVKEN